MSDQSKLLGACAMPKVGSEVVVVTDWGPDSYGGPTKRLTHRGAVRRAPDWADRGTFELDCGSRHAPIIPLKRVAAIDYLDGGPEEDWVEAQHSETGRTWRGPRSQLPVRYAVTAEVKATGAIELKVTGSKGDTYVLRRDGAGKWSCTCPGFGYRGKCKHADAASTMP